MSSVIIKDPELTLSEAVNVMAEVSIGIERSDGDSVLESAWNKLQAAAKHAADENPGAMQALIGEIEMRKRFER